MNWQNELERWLKPFLNGLGNKTLRRMCPAYITGLIGPGDRKSVQPMAASVDAISYNRFTTLLARASGTARHSKRRCGSRPMISSSASKRG